MERILYISTENLKNDTILEKNVEDNILKPCIYDSHVIDFQSIVGEKLYKHLNEATTNNTLSDREVELLKTYAYNFLIKASLLRSLPFLWAKIESSSVVKKKNDTSDSVSYDELQKLLNTTQSDKNFFGQRMIDFLNVYIDDFPLFRYSASCNVLDPNRNSNYYTSGIYLGPTTYDYKQYPYKKYII